MSSNSCDLIKPGIRLVIQLECHHPRQDRNNPAALGFSTAAFPQILKRGNALIAGSIWYAIIDKRGNQILNQIGNFFEDFNPLRGKWPITCPVEFR